MKGNMEDESANCEQLLVTIRVLFSRCMIETWAGPALGSPI